MKKKVLYFFYFVASVINLFAFEPLPKICIGKIEVHLGMKKKEIISNFGEPDFLRTDVLSINDEFSSINMDYCSEELNFYYNRGDEEIHTIKAKQDFFLFLANGQVISRNTTTKDLLQSFPDIYKISDTSYTVSFVDTERPIITDDIYFYFGIDEKLQKIIITNDYY